MSFEKINKTSYDHMGKTSFTSYDHMTYGSVNEENKKGYEKDKYDFVVDSFNHLRVNEDYRKLHIWHARRIGADVYFRLGKLAEQEGKDPGRYFTYLLKGYK